MAFHFRSFALIASIAFAASGCLVELGDGDFDDSSFSDFDDDGFVDGGGGAGGDETGEGGSGASDDGAGGGDDGVGGGQACLTEDVDPYAWELCECLSTIPTADACVEDPVAACIDDMYETSCISEDVAPLCESWGQACTGGGDTSFDVAACTEDLNAMNAQAVDTLSACIADSSAASCGDRYETCLEELVAL